MGVLDDIWGQLNNVNIQASKIEEVRGLVDDNELTNWLNSFLVEIVSYKKYSPEVYGLNQAACSEITAIADSISTYVRTIESISNKSAIVIHSPLSGHRVESTVSFASSTKVFIRFEDRYVEEVFYLVQDHQFVAGLYLPSRNLYIKYSGNPKGYINWLKRLFVVNPNDILKKIVYKGTRKIRFISSWQRPWHFFYNIGTAVDILNRHNLLNNKELVYFQGGDFIELKKFYPTLSSYKLISQSECDKTIEVLFISIGVKFETLSIEEHENFGNHVMTTMGCLPKSNLHKQIEVKKRFPTFWIGITSQKRVWVEEEEGIVLILRYLHSIFPDLYVIFDGWTNPINPLPRDVEESKSDNDKIRSIVSKLDFQLNYNSIVGESSEVKLQISALCDFYLSNYAAGSIYVSRFQRLPGISHLNTLMPRSQHLHYKNHEIPNDMVRNRPEQGESPHQISYSIEPTSALHSFQRFLHSYRFGDLAVFRK